MKKLILIAAFSILTFNITANAEWTSAFYIGTIKNVNDGRIIFTDAANGNILYQFDGTSIYGKNMLASLLACKAMGKTIRVNKSSLVVNPNWWAIDQTEIQN